MVFLRPCSCAGIHFSSRGKLGNWGVKGVGWLGFWFFGCAGVSVGLERALPAISLSPGLCSTLPWLLTCMCISPCASVRDAMLPLGNEAIQIVNDRSMGRDSKSSTCEILLLHATPDIIIRRSLTRLSAVPRFDPTYTSSIKFSLSTVPVSRTPLEDIGPFR